jgi:cation-transporting ATPase 13A1
MRIFVSLQVFDFNRRISAGEADMLREEAAGGAEPDAMAEFMALWSQPFLPNLMNTVLFLVQTSQFVAVLFVNYKGSPWMKGMLANHALFLSLFICFGGVAMCAWGSLPLFNDMLHMAEFPSDEFRWQVMGLVAASVFGTFVWDRLITALFAREVFKAMLSEAAATTLADIYPIALTAGKVVLVLGIIGSGSWLLIAGAGYLWWSRRKAAQEAAAAAAT